MGYDDDGDGYSELDGDCDDRNPDRFPGNLELCDGIDNDCDDETVDSVDEDQDGVFCDLDCDDQNPFITPGREEICDGIDNDCDPRTTASINEQGEPCDKE